MYCEELTSSTHWTRQPLYWGMSVLVPSVVEPEDCTLVSMTDEGINDRWGYQWQMRECMADGPHQHAIESMVKVVYNLHTKTSILYSTRIGQNCPYWICTWSTWLFDAGSPQAASPPRPQASFRLLSYSPGSVTAWTGVELKHISMSMFKY